jgi:hypothetical protein
MAKDFPGSHVATGIGNLDEHCDAGDPFQSRRNAASRPAGACPAIRLIKRRVHQLPARPTWRQRSQRMTRSSGEFSQRISLVVATRKPLGQARHHETHNNRSLRRMAEGPSRIHYQALICGITDSGPLCEPKRAPTNAPSKAPQTSQRLGCTYRPGAHISRGLGLT